MTKLLAVCICNQLWTTMLDFLLVSPAWPNALTCLIISLPWFLTAITHMSIESLSKRMLPPSPTSLEPFTCCVTIYFLQKQMSFETLSTRCSFPILPFWGLFTHSSLFFGEVVYFPEFTEDACLQDSCYLHLWQTHQGFSLNVPTEQW